MRANFMSSLRRRFVRDERGVISAMNLFLFVAICCVGAAAVDVTHFYAARSQLQVAADLAAHSALYTRRYGGTYASGVYYPLTDQGAKDAAITAVEYGMPDAAYGAVVDSDQIILGNLDYGTGIVVPDTTAPIEPPDSALVITDRAVDNPVGSFLFRIIGVDSMDVDAAAMFSLGPGLCDMTQGFFSRTEVRIRGGNTFKPGFCIGSPSFVVQNQNAFRPGVVTVIPDRAALDIPNSDMQTHNPGLSRSLQYEQYPALAAYLDTALDLVQITVDPTVPDFVSHPYAYSLLGEDEWAHMESYRDLPVTPLRAADFDNVFTPGDLSEPRVYGITCSGTGNDRRITLRDAEGEDEGEGEGEGDTFRSAVILTNCPVSFDGSVKLEDVLLSTSDTRPGGLASIHSPSSMTGLTIGRDDDCAPGGGAALITRSDFDMAASVNFFGVHIRAGTSVDFQSNAEGEGISVVAGQEVNTNSNITMRVCGPARGALPQNVTLRLMR